MPNSRPKPSGGAIFARLGFDQQRLRFSFRTTVAACLALVLALLIGLEHPQWSAMTVFAAAQPTRGQLFQKSANRLIGTLIGTAIGLVILSIAHDSIWLLCFLLALWVGLCTGIGNIIRGYGAYGVLLAGYSAAMVALLGHAVAGHELALGVDRFLTVLLGAVVGIAVGWIGSKSLSNSPALSAARRLLADALLVQVARVTGKEPPSVDHLLSRAALLDESLDPRAPATPQNRHLRHELRQMLTATTELILLAEPTPEPRPIELASHLQTANDLLRGGAGLGAAIPALEAAIKLSQSAKLRDFLTHICYQIGRIDTTAKAGAMRVPPVNPIHSPQHRDWVGARQAGLRTFLVLMALGAFWAITEWPAGSLLLLGTSVMVSVFSTFDNPAWIMARVGLGQTAGAIGALICLWMAWPFAHSSLQMALLMMPFLLVTPFLLAHRKTAPGATDYAMVFLLLLQPTYPAIGSFGDSLARALAVIAGPAFAYLAFRTVFATDERRRTATVYAMILSELEASAQANPAQLDEGNWSARFVQRLLRLIRMGEKSGAQLASITGPETTARALQSVGEAIHLLQNLRRRQGQTAQQQRATTVALARLARLQQSPMRAGQALQTAAQRNASDPRTASALRQAAHMLMDYPALFTAPKLA